MSAAKTVGRFFGEAITVIGVMLICSDMANSFRENLPSHDRGWWSTYKNYHTKHEHSYALSYIGTCAVLGGVTLYALCREKKKSTYEMYRQMKRKQ
jgi:hypothetical protein